MVPQETSHQGEVAAESWRSTVHTVESSYEEELLRLMIVRKIKMSHLTYLHVQEIEC